MAMRMTLTDDVRRCAEGEPPDPRHIPLHGADESSRAETAAVRATYSGAHRRALVAEPLRREPQTSA